MAIPYIYIYFNIKYIDIDITLNLYLWAIPSISYVKYCSAMNVNRQEVIARTSTSFYI